MTETAIGGSLADDETSHVGYKGNAGLDGSEDGQILRWYHTMGAMGFAVSLEQASNGASGDDDNILQAGMRYSMDMGGSVVGFGLGFSDGGTQSTVTAAVALTIFVDATGTIQDVEYWASPHLTQLVLDKFLSLLLGPHLHHRALLTPWVFLCPLLLLASQVF
jgi:hypothetical protein